MKIASGIDHKPATESSTFLALDALRGISAIVVCLAHSFYGFVTPYGGVKNWGTRLMNCGAYFAVLIFFILSGFMITVSILRNIKSHRGTFSHRAYLAARIARIYPPLIFALILQTVVFGLIHGRRLHGNETFRLAGDLFILREKAALDWQQLGAAILQLQMVFVNKFMVMNGSLWSLPYEFWIYIVVGLFTIWIVNRKGLHGLLPFSLLLALITYRNSFFGLYLGIWLIGAIWAITWHRGWHRLPTFAAWLSGGSAISLVGMCIVIREAGLGPSVQGETLGRLIFSAFACLFASITLFLTRRMWQRIIEQTRGLTEAVASTADYSYTLYLIHFPIVLLGMSVLRPVIHSRGFAVQIFSWLMIALFAVIFSRIVAPIVEDRSRCLPWLKRVLRVPPSSSKPS